MCFPLISRSLNACQVYVLKSKVVIYMYMYSFGSMIMCHGNLLMVNKLKTDGKLSPWQHNYSGHLKLHMILLSRKDDEWGGKPFTNVYGINQSYHILQININDNQIQCPVVWFYKI